MSAFSKAPTLATERLTLSAHDVDDLDALATMWADPAVYALIGGKPRTREEVWLRLLRSAGQWALLGYGAWVVRDRASGMVLGDVGLLEAKRAIEPPLTVPEVGWALAPSAHGRGLATEAMTAVLNWADAQGIDQTCCIIDPANTASIRLAERLGYVAEREASYCDHPTRVFSRLRVRAT